MKRFIALAVFVSCSVLSQAALIHEWQFNETSGTNLADSVGTATAQIVVLPGGLRADMKPGFLRFPGGCIVEGSVLDRRYQWKNTIGPIEDRKLLINRWNYEFLHKPTPDYYQSFGLGFFEFFQLCEDIGAQPLPILNCGMACQFNSGELVPLNQIDPNRKSWSAAQACVPAAVVHGPESSGSLADVAAGVRTALATCAWAAATKSAKEGISFRVLRVFRGPNCPGHGPARSLGGRARQSPCAPPRPATNGAQRTDAPLPTERIL